MGEKEKEIRETPFTDVMSVDDAWFVHQRALYNFSKPGLESYLHNKQLIWAESVRVYTSKYTLQILEKSVYVSCVWKKKNIGYIRI